MVVWGDEFGRTMNGNNNAYDVDSAATWNNYSMIGTNSPDAVATGDTAPGSTPYANNLGAFAGATNGNFAFLQYLLHLRSAHAAFRQQDYQEPVTFTNADGSGGFSEANTLSATIYVSGSAVGDEDFVILNNFSGSLVTYSVPASPAGTRWIRLIDTNNWAESSHNSWDASSGAAIGGTYGVGNQSVVVLEAVPNPAP
jgi:glycogen operon protein